MKLELHVYIQVLASNERRILGRADLGINTSQPPVARIRTAVFCKRRPNPLLPLDGLQPCDYYVMVARTEELPAVGVWPIQLRDRLPCIGVPLLPGDADARLDLQNLLHQTYDDGGYGNYIYVGEPEPRLIADDKMWANQILSSN